MVLKTLLPTFVVGFLLFCGLFEYIFVRMTVLHIEDNRDLLMDGVIVQDFLMM